MQITCWVCLIVWCVKLALGCLRSRAPTGSETRFMKSQRASVELQGSLVFWKYRTVCSTKIIFSFGACIEGTLLQGTSRAWDEQNVGHTARQWSWIHKGSGSVSQVKNEPRHDLWTSSSKKTQNISMACSTSVVLWYEMLNKHINFLLKNLTDPQTLNCSVYTNN